jgi:hypothetical protein
MLFPSHRSAANHLHRIFPKLWITSRVALRDASRTRPLSARAIRRIADGGGPAGPSGARAG